MRRARDGPTLTEGFILGHDSLKVVTPLAPRSALAGPSRDCRLARSHEPAHGAIERLITWLPASGRVPLPPLLDGHNPDAGRSERPAEGAWASASTLPTAKSDWSGWRWLRRLFDLSGLGWTFVFSAVCWELFALAFSQRAGWGWDKGVFFFAWGIGVLALGFYLRSNRKRPAVSRLFLGINVLVLGVLSLVVATK